MDLVAVSRLIEFYGVDSLIRVLTLYYLFKLGNVAVILLGNLGEALFKIYNELRAREGENRL